MQIKAMPAMTPPTTAAVLFDFETVELVANAPAAVGDSAVGPVDAGLESI